MFRGVLTGVENPTPRGGSGFGGHGKPPQHGVWAVGQDLPVGRRQGGSPGRACHLSPPPDRAGCGLPGQEDLCTHTGMGARGRELRPRQAESTGRARLPPRSHTWGSSKFWAKWGQTGGPGSRQPAGCPGLGCGLRGRLLGATSRALRPAPPWGPTPSLCGPGTAAPRSSTRLWLPASGCHRRQRQAGRGLSLLPAPVSALAPCATHLFPATGHTQGILDLPCH